MMKSNLVIIGLAGVGKSTVGKRLSALLSLPFIDMDEEIEKKYGPIPTLFQKGEDYFRDIESRIARSVSSREGLIISTGGGVVLRQTNMEALKNNGIIFYLKRPVEEILKTMDVSNRPLLRDDPEKLYKLHEEREPLYIKYCDYIIDTSDIDNAISSIKAIWNRLS